MEVNGLAQEKEKQKKEKKKKESFYFLIKIPTLKSLLKSKWQINVP